MNGNFNLGSGGHLVGQVEMYSMPHGVTPNREVDKPIGVREFTIPIERKFNEIRTGIKEILANFMGSVKNATTSTTEVESGDVRIGSVYKVKTSACTIGGLEYPVGAILVATAKTYTGGPLILVWDNKDLAHNLFTVQGALTPSDDGDGGIAFASIQPSEMEEKFVTEVNAQASNYCEWKGLFHVSGSGKTFNGNLGIGVGYIDSTNRFASQYASVPVTQYVDAERDFVVYWKISVN